MSIEDLDAASEAIEVRDAIELWESGYYKDAERWVAEAIQALSVNASELVSRIRSDMHDYCNNDVADKQEPLVENAENLAAELGDIIEKLTLVQQIAAKVEQHEFMED